MTDTAQPSVAEDEDDYMLNVINNVDYRMPPGQYAPPHQEISIDDKHRRIYLKKK